MYANKQLFFYNMHFEENSEASAPDIPHPGYFFAAPTPSALNNRSLTPSPSTAPTDSL
jgi:hypothetical protein